ncbi:response regulator [Larkinella arboricola]
MSFPNLQQPPSTELAGQVLIVEDNLINQAFLSTLLRKYGISNAVVNNGLEAVNFLKTETVDLVLMDIQMPVMDGLMATRMIREQLQLTVPIVAVTSNPEFDAWPRCLAAGMNDFLSKPVQKRRLEAVLQRFLPEKEQKPPVIDRAYLEEMTGGSSELLNELIDFFKNELPNNRQALFDALEQQNREEFDRVAHRFRSSLNSIAMLGLAAELKKLERNPALPDDEIREKLTILFGEIAVGLKTLDEVDNR